MVHLERPGKKRDRQAWNQLASLRSWKRGEGLKLERYEQILKGYYTDESLAKIAMAPNPFLNIVKKTDPQFPRYRVWVQPIERKP